MLRNVCILGLALAVPLALMGQHSGVSNGEADAPGISLEQSYRPATTNSRIIWELSRGPDWDMKSRALEQIKDALAQGNRDMFPALEYLALEGTLNKSIRGEDGIAGNTYPGIRLRAATYLGDLGCAEAEKTLIKMLSNEPDPSVLTEVIKSLVKIDLNEKTISFITKRLRYFDFFEPNNHLALSSLTAYEKCVADDKVLGDSEVELILRMSEGPYASSIRSKARTLLHIAP
jgi:hypothetical protein